MARFRRFRRSYGAKTKRNAERILRAGTSAVPLGSQVVAYTYTATQACVAKSIKMDLGAIGGFSDNSALAYCLVVVREGYNANAITYPALTDDMYNPTQDVLISGVLTDNSSEDHKFNMIGRKLKRGDRICLIVREWGAGTGTTPTCAFEMNFSVLT